MKWLVTSVFLLMTANTLLFTEEVSFFAATHPKGGTGLLIKALHMLAGERPTQLFCHYDGCRYSPRMLDEVIERGGLPVLHLFSPHFTYHYLMKYHLNSKVVIIMRDIRDAFVSYAFWAYSHLNIPIEEKISLVFEDDAYCEMSNNLSLFLNHPRFFVVRFEDLVGPKGGGDLHRQIKAIQDIGTCIGKYLTENEAEAYAKNLFGNQQCMPQSGTFREGKIGSWSVYFTEEHKRLFKEKFNGELIRLGYAKDKNW